MEYQKMLLGKDNYFISVVKTSYPTHFHSEIEVVYCTKGHIHIATEEQQYHLYDGCVLLLSSLSQHKIDFISDDAEALVIEFGAQFLDDRFYEFAVCDFDNPLILADEQSERARLISSILREIYEEYDKRDVGSDWMIRSCFFKLFAVIVRTTLMKQPNTERKRFFDKYMRIQEALDIIATEYQEPLALERVASVVGYEVNSFCRLFKSVTNMTFHNYLNMYRVNVAKHLLKHEAYTINEIGFLTGLPVPKTFSRVFREYVGMSPREYRKTETSRDEKN